VVAVAHRLCLQGGEVGAGAGLGEPLAPDLLASKDPREVPVLLLRGAFGDKRRPGVEEPDEVHADVRGAGAFGLLQKDQVLGWGSAAAADLARPIDAGVSGVVEHPLPARVPFSAGGPLLRPRLGRQRRQSLGEPGAQLGAKTLVGFRIPKVH
jgi:hypothetical protein